MLEVAHAIEVCVFTIELETHIM